MGPAASQSDSQVMVNPPCGQGVMPSLKGVVTVNDDCSKQSSQVDVWRFTF